MSIYIKDSMEQSIDFKNLKIDYILKKPFDIFKINNFYTDTIYNFISNNFPVLNSNQLNLITKYNNKYYFDSESEIYRSLLKSNKAVKFLHDSVYNKEFLNFFYNKFFFYFLIARKSFPLNLLTLLKLKKYNFTNKNINSIRKIFFLNIKPIIEYSYIFNNGKVLPHTDNNNKLLSILTYFPENINNIKYKKKQNDLGTEFWISKIKNYENIHLKENDEKKFRINNKLIYKAPFEGKTLYGFIKNEFSWHGVEQINMPKNYIRKSININLMLDI